MGACFPALSELKPILGSDVSMTLPANWLGGDLRKGNVPFPILRHSKGACDSKGIILCMCSGCGVVAF